MRLLASVFVLSTLVGCSSAGDLPFGGPYGGTVAGQDAAVAPADAGIVFVQASPGTGTGTGAGFQPGTGSSGTGTGTATGTGNTGTGTGSTGTGAGTANSGTGTGTGNTGTGAGTGNTGTGTGAGNTGTGTGTGNTGTGTGNTGNTGTGAGTGSTGTGTGTGSSGAPTWTELYTNYLAVGTIGNCDGSCHRHSQCSSPSSCYSWIGSGNRGALSGGGGLLSWDQGYMPTNGPTSEPQAEADFTAWAAAGSQNN